MTKTALIARALLVSVMLGAVVLGCVALLMPTTQAAAGTNCTYYSNASYTTVVGQFGKDCCNNPVAWGVKTKYSRCGGCFVCFPPNP